MVNALAQTPPASDYKALVCVFLFGGNDGNNLIVPLNAYAKYAAARTLLALPQNTLLPVTAATGNAPYGFHPNLTGIQTLFTQKKAAVVANVGTLIQTLSRPTYLNPPPGTLIPYNLFSHSDQQTEWQTGIPKAGAPSGWGGRVADAVAFMNAPSTFPTGLSVAGNNTYLNGVTTQPTTLIPGNVPGLAGDNGSTAAAARDTAFQQLLTFDTGLQLVQSASNVTSEGLRVAGVLKSVLNNSLTLKTVFPNTSIGQELLQVAQIIKARTELNMHRQVFFVSLGGFDTHTDQLATQADLFTQLSDALLAFYNATVELTVDSQVTTFTESDFSRTFQPGSGGSTATVGSDHAWASNHLVIGGAVKGGDVYGAFPDFTLGGQSDTDNRGVWIPSVALDQYGATIAQWFGVPAGNMSAIFPDLGNFASTQFGTNLGFV
jgi:uncharacterized protein (DUF1501 family)